MVRSSAAKGRLLEVQARSSEGIVLPPGQFYGTLEQTRTDGAFDIRSLAASGREEDVAVHTHTDAHFVLVLSGVYISAARWAPERARAPFLVFNPPGTTHRDRFFEGVGSFLAISLSATTLAELRNLVTLSDVSTTLARPDAVSRAFRVAREMRAAGQDRGVIESASWELLALSAEVRGPRVAPGWAYAAYEALMDQAGSAHLSIADVARAAGVHPVHLARVFRHAWGCSPGELLRWRRAEKAADLLAGTATPAAEIAAMVGFVDQSHMNRAFRALYGLTPSAWRRARHVAPIQDPVPAER
jgi:AraC family transcriptional regulator